jgi:hypothetical protein
MRSAFSQGFPDSFYFFLADLEVVPVSGEDFEGDRFIVLDVFEFSHNLFEIDDPGADGQMTILLSEVVIGVDMADPVTMETDELRGSILSTPEVGMADIQGKPDFRKGIENRLKLMRLGKKVGLGKHILDTEGDIEVDGLLQDGFERFHRISLCLVQEEFP